jgi:molecular chaperone GrpE
MSEAENAAGTSPLEPEASAAARDGGDAISALEIESVQILVGAPGAAESAPDLPDATAVPSSTRSEHPRGAADVSEPVLRTVRTLGEQLDKRLDALQVLFEREQRAEAARERVIDRLHAELQEYKQDLLLKVQRPIFIDLIQLHDDIGKMIEAQSQSQWQSATDAGPQGALDARGTLESIQTGIEDILYRQGVEPFVRDGNEFDPRRQRAISTVPTEDLTLAKTVAARLRKGFQAGDKVIRPEIVTVYAVRPTRAAGALDG